MRPELLSDTVHTDSFTAYNNNNKNFIKLESIDRKTRKQMTIYDMLHPRADVQRLYLPRGQLRGPWT